MLIEKILDAKIDPLLEHQFASGRLYAAISSRPGQSGRADGYILEGKELEVRCTPLFFRRTYSFLTVAHLYALVLPQEAQGRQTKARARLSASSCVPAEAEGKLRLAVGGVPKPL